MSLFTQTLEAYGVDLRRTPFKPRIFMPDEGEPEGIIVEQFLLTPTGACIVAGDEFVTGLQFFPEPNMELKKEENN